MIDVSHNEEKQLLSTNQIHIMRLFYLTPFVLIIFLCTTLRAQKPELNKTLWYKQPAKNWDEALPIGNGRLGAMIFGEVENELIQLNEETLWTGGPADSNPNPEAIKYLPQVRKQLFEGNNREAVKLMQKMQGPNTNMYQPLANLHLKQKIDGVVSHYTRTLNIADAIATTSFTVNDVNYKRELFASFPNQVIVMRLTASKKNALNVSFGLDDELEHQVKTEANNQIILSGKARITSDERRNIKPFIYSDSLRQNGMRYQARLKVIRTDGKLSTDSLLNVSGAT